MKIAGLVKSSLIDYPGKVAAVVFTQGCNFRCGFCHNPDLIPLETENPESLITETQLFDFLKTRVGKLDGVVITGGEPLIHLNVFNLIKEIKAMGFLVKLDTNGSNPVLLKKIIENNLVDYIAMDVKNSLEKYQETCDFNDSNNILTSIELIMSSGIDYEFRTTVLPFYHNKEYLSELSKLIKGAKKFTIQGFRPKIVYNKALQKEKSFTRDELTEIAEIFKKNVDNVVIHDNIA